MQMIGFCAALLRLYAAMVTRAAPAADAMLPNSGFCHSFVILYV